MANPKYSGLLEEDLEGILQRNPELIKFKDSHVVEWLFRQFELPVGIVDLIGIDSKDRIVVAEVKRRKASGAAVSQVNRYGLNVSYLVSQTGLNSGIVRCVIAESIPKQLAQEALMQNVEPFEMSVTEEGISVTRIERDMGMVETIRDHSHSDDALHFEVYVNEAIREAKREQDRKILEEEENADDMFFLSLMDRDGCEWFESPTWEIMDDEPEESRYRKAVVDCVVEIFGEV